MSHSRKFCAPSGTCLHVPGRDLRKDDEAHGDDPRDEHRVGDRKAERTRDLHGPLRQAMFLARAATVAPAPRIHAATPHAATLVHLGVIVSQCPAPNLPAGQRPRAGAGRGHRAQGPSPSSPERHGDPDEDEPHGHHAQPGAPARPPGVSAERPPGGEEHHDRDGVRRPEGGADLARRGRTGRQSGTSRGTRGGRRPRRR